MIPDCRSVPRSLCADLVTVEWKDTEGWLHEVGTVLEDISEQGAGLQVESAIPPGIDVLIRHKGTALFSCRTIYCVYRDIGYYVGVEYRPGVVWSKRDFLPSHLLDLEQLLARRASETRN
jgi:hypothetical protein